MTTVELNAAYKQTVTCPTCDKKTNGYVTGQKLIVCHWCGVVFEDDDETNLFPEVEKIK